ncbi:glyoxylase-like metal-dependent hydrolase (beta-lactamase superfamily II) [Herbaspirillum sp. Sphag1AN]|uniref:MBL fold metallo-hydrolase n=1 Tax=unclassified Herbaspirillum TaxID=2624150 RepID=UPI00161BD7DD|nr:MULTISPECIES: MBL fold metallo-hydrolase [unclassified Herbaspirillum]MBB3213612.1 glyoxylase-like metal-dependent hydrolase (beta-lactamase superfamily II) [Herbaspirillum sp. Sphag1AN]MBB3246810.1 glyoxylase-like metal-dependent hydrolase (beta-lactamase superfamily II) [Herbaspirillum sp. Sphag64]
MPANPHALPASVHVLERGWLSANNILFLGRDETALVDSGYVTHAAQTISLIEHSLQSRQRPVQLNRLFNTHLHSDHCGGNAMLQARFGCHTSIPAGETDKVSRWDENALSFQATGQQCPRFGFDAGIEDGATLMLGDLSWQALAAPGHDPHSLIFYCAPERLLISADALWRNGFGVIFPELEGESGFPEVAATLDLIATLDVRLVIPGHGAPFTDVAAALARARTRLDYLRSDPLRNAQNAVKVILKFLLLERQAISLDSLPALMTETPLLALCNQQFFHSSAEALADWASNQLIKAGAAARSATHLLNAG